jgi:hypothetical protein
MKHGLMIDGVIKEINPVERFINMKGEKNG